MLRWMRRKWPDSRIRCMENQVQDSILGINAIYYWWFIKRQAFRYQNLLISDLNMKFNLPLLSIARIRIVGALIHPARIL